MPTQAESMNRWVRDQLPIPSPLGHRGVFFESTSSLTEVN